VGFFTGVLLRYGATFIAIRYRIKLSLPLSLHFPLRLHWHAGYRSLDMAHKSWWWKGRHPYNLLIIFIIGSMTIILSRSPPRPSPILCLYKLVPCHLILQVLGIRRIRGRTVSKCHHHEFSCFFITFLNLILFLCLASLSQLAFDAAFSAMKYHFRENLL